ncbi:MAG: cyclic nucleotide-binding domain-containing protein, partial [Pirellulaceae bacterium]
IAVAGVAAIVVIAVGRLVGGREETNELDKLLHFSGYAILAGLFVLALRPVLYLPAMGLLVGMGFLIEYLQSLTGRSMDFTDGVANTLGVAVGAAVALLIRAAHSYVRRELAIQHVRRNLVHFDPGEMILREGGRVRTLYVIKNGRVRLSKRIGDKEVELGRGQSGDVLGTLGVLLGVPQFATIEAVGPTTLYRMELTELMDSAGGHEQPVCIVLRSLAESLRHVAEKMAKTEAQREELTLATISRGEPED